MDIPILTKFIEGLKLFFASKRLKWLTLIFFIGAFTITIWENLALMFSYIPGVSGIALMVGGVFPTYFLVTGFVAFLGLARFVADEESYRKSLLYTFIWIFVSIFMDPFCSVGSTLFLYSFSKKIGTNMIRWGRISAKAFSITGVAGSLPRMVTWTPFARGKRKSKAHP